MGNNTGYNLEHGEKKERNVVRETLIFIYGRGLGPQEKKCGDVKMYFDFF